MAPSANDKKNKKFSALRAQSKPNGFGKKKSQSKDEKYPLCPWKLTRYQSCIVYHHCDECRDKNYKNEKKAVETPNGGVRVSLYFCKKCAEANIFMGNIYKKTWRTDPDVEEEREELDYDAQGSGDEKKDDDDE